MADAQLVLSNEVAQGLDIIGDRWVLLILRDAFLGRHRFEEFRRYTGASRATLSRRLGTLVANDVLYKHPYSNSATRFEYKLTEKGLSLYGASLLAWQWELEWAEAQGNTLPPALYHSLCQQTLQPVAVCRQCQLPLQIEDVEWLPAATKLDAQLSTIRSVNKQRRVRTAQRHGEEDLSLDHITDLIGDRWSLLILIAAFFGIKRFDDFSKGLHIASNVLDERLKHLQQAAILQRHEYQLSPPRSEYILTAKGRSLYSFTMALRQWVIDWLGQPVADSELLHKPCGQRLVVDIQCSGCGHKPWPKDVRQRQSAQ